MSELNTIAAGRAQLDGCTLLGRQLNILASALSLMPPEDHAVYCKLIMMMMEHGSTPPKPLSFGEMEQFALRYGVVRARFEIENMPAIDDLTGAL